MLKNFSIFFQKQKEPTIYDCQYDDIDYDDSIIIKDIVKIKNDLFLLKKDIDNDIFLLKKEIINMKIPVIIAFFFYIVFFLWMIYKIIIYI